MLQVGVISLMPEMFEALQHGITGRAIEQQLLNIRCWNPRDWAEGTYRQVDDKPYGGGPGMVMMYKPLDAAIRQAKSELPQSVKTVYLSPQGRKIDQELIRQQAKQRQHLLLIAGRYEGIDERVISSHVDEEWSLGDFVLSGGELAAMVLIDAITRLLPGSLGDPGSAEQDSFSNCLLDHPHYTRPAEIDGMAVPDVLLQGDHKLIERWRRKQALGQTWLKRPDLLENFELTESDARLLKEFKEPYKSDS